MRRKEQAFSWVMLLGLLLALLNLTQHEPQVFRAYSLAEPGTYFAMWNGASWEASNVAYLDFDCWYYQPGCPALNQSEYQPILWLRNNGTDLGIPTFWLNESPPEGYAPYCVASAAKWALPFDEGEGTSAKDLSGEKELSWGVRGPSWPLALRFNGTYDQRAEASVGQMENLTVAVWVKCDEVPSSNRLVLCPGAEFRFNVEYTGKWFVWYTNASGNGMLVWKSGDSLCDGGWHFVAWRRNATSGTLAAWLDDTKVVSDKADNGPPKQLEVIKVGGWGGAYSFLGEVDEIMIWNRSLGDEEVEKLYEGRYVDRSGLVAHYKFGLADSSEVYDHAYEDGAYQDLTLYGSPEWVNSSRKMQGCKRGSCLYFDGYDDIFAKSPWNTSWNRNEMTLALFAKVAPVDVGTVTLLNIRKEGSKCGYRVANIWVGASSLGCSFCINESYYFSAYTSGDYDDNQLHSIVATYDGRYARLYVDGELKEEVEKPGMLSSYRGAQLYIGDFDGGKTNCGGLSAGKCPRYYIDQIYILPFALTPEEVRYYNRTGQIYLSASRLNLPKEVLRVTFDDLLKGHYSQARKIRDFSGYENHGTLYFDQVMVWDTGSSTDYDTLDPEGEGWTKVTSTSHSFSGDMVFENSFIRVVVSKITTDTIALYVWSEEAEEWVHQDRWWFKAKLDGTEYVAPGWGAELTYVGEDKAVAKIETPTQAWFEVELKSHEPYFKLIVHPNGSTVNWVKLFPYFRKRFEIASEGNQLGFLLDRWFAGTYQGATDNVGTLEFSGGNAIRNFGVYVEKRSEEHPEYTGRATVMYIGGINKVDSSSYTQSRWWNDIYLVNPEDGDFVYVGGFPYNLSRDSVLIEAEDYAYGSATKIVSNRSRVGESVGTGDGSKTHFYLDYAHVVPDSEEIYVDGVLQTSGYSMNYDTGQIIFDSPPASGAVIEANYSYYDAYPGDGSYNAVKYEGSGEALIVFPQVVCPGKGRYRIFVKAKCVGGTGQQFRIKLDGSLQEGSWISCGAADTYWQAWDAGTFWIDDCAELRLYAKGASSSQPLVVDYLLLVRLPDNDEPDEVFSFENGEAAKAVISYEANGTDLALEFDGVDDSIEIANGWEVMQSINSSGEFTLIAWINSPAPTGNTQYIISYGNWGDPENNLDFGLDSYGKPRLWWEYSGGTDYYLVADQVVADGSWHCLAFVGKSHYAAIYVDGSLAKEDTAAPDFWEMNSLRSLWLGSYRRNYLFHGRVRKLELFNRMLTDSEIEALCNNKASRFSEVILNTSRLNLCGTYLLPNEDCYLWCYMNVTYPEKPWYFDLLAEVT